MIFTPKDLCILLCDVLTCNVIPSMALEVFHHIFNLLQIPFYHAPALNLVQKDKNVKVDAFIHMVVHAACSLNNEGCCYSFKCSNNSFGKGLAVEPFSICFTVSKHSFLTLLRFSAAISIYQHLLIVIVAFCTKLIAS